jgi:hypothetical protein
VSRLAAVGWSEMSPAVDGGETVIVEPLWLELRRNAGYS